jgi:TPR repeat protein
MIGMSTGRGINSDLKPAVLHERRLVPRWLPRAHCIAVAAVMLFSTGNFASAQSLRQGISAFNHQDYGRATGIFIPLAERGEASAQTYLGFMFETGRGVPQNYTEAAMWYRRAAEQGDSLAQYSLGLLYDRGQGVPRDIVEANKWLNLSTAGAPRNAREARARIRDAVTSKMTRGEIARARLRALEWAPIRER